MFHEILDEAQAGDNVGVLLRGIERREVERGQVLAALVPSLLIPISKEEVCVLTKEEGEDILLSSMVIVLSFTLELLMLLERLNSLKG